MTRKEPFAQIPECVLDSAVSGNAVRLFGILGLYAKGTGECWPTLATLAGRMRLSDREVRRTVQELVDVSAVRVERRAGRTSNRYLLTGHACPDTHVRTDTGVRTTGHAWPDTDVRRSRELQVDKNLARENFEKPNGNGHVNTSDDDADSAASARLLAALVGEEPALVGPGIAKALAGRLRPFLPPDKPDKGSPQPVNGRGATP